MVLPYHISDVGDLVKLPTLQTGRPRSQHRKNSWTSGYRWLTGPDPGVHIPAGQSAGHSFPPDITMKIPGSDIFSGSLLPNTVQHMQVHMPIIRVLSCSHDTRAWHFMALMTLITSHRALIIILFHILWAEHNWAPSHGKSVSVRGRALSHRLNFHSAEHSPPCQKLNNEQ